MKANTITTNIIKLLTTSTKVIAIVFSMAWVVFKFLWRSYGDYHREFWWE